jgi:hypothetical protein
VGASVSRNQLSYPSTHTTDCGELLNLVKESSAHMAVGNCKFLGERVPHLGDGIFLEEHAPHPQDNIATASIIDLSIIYNTQTLRPDGQDHSRVYPPNGCTSALPYPTMLCTKSRPGVDSDNAEMRSICGAGRYMRDIPLP